MTNRSPIRYFKTSPEIMRLWVMLFIRFPLSLRNVEDLMLERGIEVSHKTVRFWWVKFGAGLPPPLVRYGDRAPYRRAVAIRQRAAGSMRS